MSTKRRTVADTIADEIVNGVYLPGAQLPPERELSKRHGASRDVVRLALADLADVGRVQSVQGAGWFVRVLTPLRYPLHVIDTNRGQGVADVWISWLVGEGRTGGNELTVDPATRPPEDVRMKLGLEPDTLMVARRRTRLVNREPWMISTGWWPLWIAAGTDIERPVYARSQAIANSLGHHVLRTENEIGARMPTTTEAAELGTGRGVPVMTMLTTRWGAEDCPLHCTIDVFPAHRFLLLVQPPPLTGDPDPLP